MNVSELIMFGAYLVFMVCVGVVTFLRTRGGGEKDYFLGGRKMGAWVSGLSAGASDMSAWVLMGLPASVYSFGMGKTWIAIGLFIGYALSWILVAPRLRAFSVVCADSITIPQYLTNRFLSKSRALQLVSAVIFLVAYTVYAASSIKACGTLFNTVLGVDAKAAMYIAAVIIVGYTFLGGFSAVSWTDFFQGLLMLGALLIAPLAAVAMLPSRGGAASAVNAEYWKLFTNWKDVVSGMGWGLGYFGMPHIIIRFMAVKSQKELRKARRIGVGWTFLILTFSVVVGIVGHLFLGDDQEGSVVFITMVRRIFSGPVLGLLSGLLLSAILAGAMSTADSQLLAASSAFASDVYNLGGPAGGAGDLRPGAKHRRQPQQRHHHEPGGERLGHLRRGLRTGDPAEPVLAEDDLCRRGGGHRLRRGGGYPVAHVLRGNRDLRDRPGLPGGTAGLRAGISAGRRPRQGAGGAV